MDYEIQELAIERASAILQETLGGEFGQITESKLTKALPKPKKVTLLGYCQSLRCFSVPILRRKSDPYSNNFL